MGKEELQSAEFIALKTTLLEIIFRLENEYNMYRNDMAERIKKLTGVSIDSFYRYARGECPPSKINKLKKIIEELIKLEDQKKLEKLEKTGSSVQYQKNSTEKFETKDNTLPYKSLVCIYYSPKLKTEPYNGMVKKIGIPTLVNDEKAIIAYPNDSIQFEDADGLVPMLDHGGEPSARFESLIAIKKIDIDDCASGNQYYFFDKANQPFLRTLYKEYKKEKIYRLVAENSNRYPDLELAPKKIAVAFRVTSGTGKLKPNIPALKPHNNSADITNDTKDNQDGNNLNNEAGTELNTPGR